MEIKHRWQLNKLLPKNPIVAEIGVAEGLFSLEILQKWDPKLLYMVDIWESNGSFPGDAGSPQEWHNKNYKEAMERVKGYPVNVLRGPSVGMAQHVVKDGSLDLVYLDACHSFDCVTADLKAWLPKLKKGGVMAGHDFLNKDYQVFEAVEQFWKIGIHTIPENSNSDAGFYFIV